MATVDACQHKLRKQLSRRAVLVDTNPHHTMHTAAACCQGTATTTENGVKVIFQGV